MALAAGNSGCTSGLSQRIYDYLVADSRNGFSSPMSAAQSDAVKALCYAVARAVVDEIVANAAVTVTVAKHKATFVAKKGAKRDGGSYEQRMGGIACWNAIMDENEYMVRKWNEFVAA